MWDGIDRRKFPRVEYPCLITIRKKIVPPLSMLTHTENISIGGVRVIIPKRIEVMTEVDLEIDLMDTLMNVLSKGRIKWVKEFRPDRQDESVPEGGSVKVLTGIVSWVKEVSPRQQGKPPHYDTGIKFTNIKDADRQRIARIIEHLTGKSH